MHARHGAVRGAGFFGEIFAAQIFARISRERDAGIAALLRAVVHEAVFADVEVARAGATAPLVRPAVGEVILKAVDARVTFLTDLLHLLIDFALDALERLERAEAVVNDAERA